MEEQVIQPPSGGGHKGLLIFIIIFALLAGAAGLVFGVNRFHLVIELEGSENMTLEYGTPYEEPGCRVMLKGTLFLKQGRIPEDVNVTVDGTVGEELGEYSIIYSCETRFLSGRAERRVTVVDTTPPELKLVADPYGDWIDGKPYKEEGYQATDLHDGDLTEQVQRQELYGRVLYTVSDSSGNKTQVERKIPLYDPLPPTILLNGQKTILLQLGRPYEEAGYIALDNVDGDLTDKVTVSGDVDVFTPGIYPIQYKVPDTHGNWTIQIRTVEVLKAPRPEIVTPKGKVIYLTFDDGPGPYTEELLDILGVYGIKATFFVTDSGYDEVMKRIVEEGHSIGIHTVNHDYDTIYQNPESYFADLYAMQDLILEKTGVNTTLLRFPGGSSNLISRPLYRGLMTKLTRAVQDAGFQYFDWNVDSNDAGGAISSRQVAINVIAGLQENRVSVVLQHDIHDYSVAAVEEIILWGLGNGYTFLPLESDSPVCHHPILN